MNVLLTQGFRDSLFNFNEAYANYQCLEAAGGDVRLITYQAGHNTPGFVADPGAQYQPAGNADNFDCGSLNKGVAALAFMNEHLKGMVGAADAIPELCLSMHIDDAIAPAAVLTGKAGTAFSLPQTTVTSGGVPNQAVVAQLGASAVAPAGSMIVAGIPYAEINVSATTGIAPGDDPIIFVGLGQRRASGAGAGQWDLIDNQLMPIRGLGDFTIDLAGVAERLNEGDELGLLFYGNQDQFDVAGAKPPNNFPVNITGTVWLPLLPGDTPTFP